MYTRGRKLLFSSSLECQKKKGKMEKKRKKLSNIAETLFNSPGSGVVACLCGNTTGGGQKPPPATGCTTLTGLDGRVDGTNSGDAA